MQLKVHFSRTNIHILLINIFLKPSQNNTMKHYQINLEASLGFLLSVTT